MTSIIRAYSICSHQRVSAPAHPAPLCPRGCSRATAPLSSPGVIFQLLGMIAIQINSVILLVWQVRKAFTSRVHKTSQNHSGTIHLIIERKQVPHGSKQEVPEPRATLQKIFLQVYDFAYLPIWSFLRKLELLRISRDSFSFQLPTLYDPSTLPSGCLFRKLWGILVCWSHTNKDATIICSFVWSMVHLWEFLITLLQISFCPGYACVSFLKVDLWLCGNVTTDAHTKDIARS